MIVSYIRSEEAEAELTGDFNGVQVHPERTMSFHDDVRLFPRMVFILPAAAARLPPPASRRVRHARRHDARWTGLGTARSDHARVRRVNKVQSPPQTRHDSQEGGGKRPRSRDERRRRAGTGRRGVRGVPELQGARPSHRVHRLPLPRHTRRRNPRLPRRRGAPRRQGDRRRAHAGAQRVQDLRAHLLQGLRVELVVPPRGRAHGDCAARSKGDKEILPVFFDASPSDVKLRTGLYMNAMAKHRKKFGAEEVKRREDALVEVAESKGRDLKTRGHGEAIKLIIRVVLFKLKIKHKYVTNQLVGVDDHVEDIMKQLDVDCEGVCFVGIHGMGGVGKTTLAKVVFNQLCSYFNDCCFLGDVQESSEKGGLVNLQKQLYSDILDSRFVDNIHDIDDGINQIGMGFHSKKVLMVLDDVDKEEQLEKLAGTPDWFGSGSRIIITTRNEITLKVLDEVLIYELKELSFDQALKLFCIHAFKKVSPPYQYDTPASEIVVTTGGLPLALEVIGSFLYHQPEEIWKETVERLAGIPRKDVRQQLLISYEALEDEEKQIFLDIACFFINTKKTCNLHVGSLQFFS